MVRDAENGGNSPATCQPRRRGPLWRPNEAFPAGTAGPTVANFAVTDSEGQQRRTIHYSGHVQGVGFRYTARRVAARFSVSGYVQNLPDGRVKLVAEGATPELDRCLAAVRAALTENIDQEQTENAAATGEFQSFDILF